MTMVTWVSCPICREPDMRQETDAEGNSLIFCVNHGCRSNGGTSDASIIRLDMPPHQRAEIARDRAYAMHSRMGYENHPDFGKGLKR